MELLHLYLHNSILSQACNGIALPLHLQLHTHTGLRDVRKDSFITSPLLTAHIPSQNNFSFTQSLYTPVAVDPVGVREIRTLVELLLVRRESQIKIRQQKRI
jgi:hypothetical protein